MLTGTFQRVAPPPPLSPPATLIYCMHIVPLSLKITHPRLHTPWEVLLEQAFSKTRGARTHTHRTRWHGEDIPSEYFRRRVARACTLPIAHKITPEKVVGEASFTVL